MSSEVPGWMIESARVQHRVSYNERPDAFHGKPILAGLDAVAIAARDALCAAAAAVK